jgi:hypothetical protein
MVPKFLYRGKFNNTAPIPFYAAAKHVVTKTKKEVNLFGPRKVLDPPLKPNQPNQRIDPRAGNTVTGNLSFKHHHRILLT